MAARGKSAAARADAPDWRPHEPASDAEGQARLAAFRQALELVVYVNVRFWPITDMGRCTANVRF
jgi:hypothetical protein